MSTHRRVNMRSALGIMALAGLLLTTPSACTVSHGGPQDGTETGNPPIIDSKLIALVVQSDAVHVTGRPGAVSPGGSALEVVSSFTAETFHGTAAANGSFDIAVTTTPLDTFEVRALQGKKSSNAVYVVRGAAAVTGGSDDGLSCKQREDLAKAQMTAVSQMADLLCSDDTDCVSVSVGTACNDSCGEIAVSRVGQAELDDARLTIEGGLCKDFKADGCSVLALPCVQPPNLPDGSPGIVSRCFGRKCVMMAAELDAGSENNAGVATSDAGTGGPTSISGTLVSQLASDPSGAIATPHEIELFNADTGDSFDPPIVTRSAAITGSYGFANVPQNVNLALHVKGVGAANEPTSTFDAITYYAPNAGDNLLRIGQVGTASLPSVTGVFTASQDRASLSGTVYRVDASGKRIGTVGCAQLFLDRQQHPALIADQRYVAQNGLPTRLDKLDKTLAGLGRFYFGNVAKGEHLLRVSVDGGQTFIAERTFVVPYTRAEAAAQYKEILYFIGIDVGGADPTPAGCASF